LEPPDKPNRESGLQKQCANSNSTFIENIDCLTVILLLIIVFVILTILVIKGLVDNFDLMIMNRLNISLSSNQKTIFKAISNLGTLFIIISLPSLWTYLLMKKNKRMIYFIGSILLTSFIIRHIIKILVARPRPEYTITLLGDSASFPSGHVLFAFCFYSFLAITFSSQSNDNLKKILVWMISIIVIILISVSRIALKAHYPTDILASVILGTLLVMIIYFCLDKIEYTIDLIEKYLIKRLNLIN
jgi:undecaprenyl-diphosphatase